MRGPVLFVVLALSCQNATASVLTDFNSFSTGSVNGQGGWTATGPYDQEVVDLGGGNKVWRVSNATTSGSFGDMPFSAPSGTPGGESTAAGAVTNTYYSSFDIWSVTRAAQPGLRLTISPDAGSGQRQSFVAIDDTGSGFDVSFFDYQTGPGFVSTVIATGLSYTGIHSIAFDMLFVDGNTPENDVVNVYVNGGLAHTGTSWEQFYPDVQPSDPSPFAIDTLLFRISGTAAPGTQGEGFYIDNVLITDVAPGVVPEPIALLTWAGLIGCAAVAARRPQR